MNINSVLETERLRLREYRLDDLDDLVAILGDPETMQYYPAPYTRDGALEWIQDNIPGIGKMASDCGLWSSKPLDLSLATAERL